METNNERSKSLNKYILSANIEKNEWVFSGEIWKAIEDLLASERQRLQKMIMGKIIQDNQIIAETEEHKFGRGMLNFVLSDILKFLED